jgi:hypothetical protein
MSGKVGESHIAIILFVVELAAGGSGSGRNLGR